MVMFCWCLQETITTSKEVKFTVDNIDGSADVIQTNETVRVSFCPNPDVKTENTKLSLFLFVHHGDP